MMEGKVKAKAKGTIGILVALLASSAILRISLSATEVIAEVTKDEIVATQTQEMPDAETIETDMQISSDVRPTSELLRALKEREKRVVTLEQKLVKQQEAIKIAKAEIERRMLALEAVEKKVSATLTKASSAAENDVVQLIQVYENMKPKEASALFEAMEPSFAAGFLGRMRPDAAAGVMAGLSPEVAYSISVILAGRNAKAPKN